MPAMNKFRLKILQLDWTYVSSIAFCMITVGGRKKQNSLVRDSYKKVTGLFLFVVNGDGVFCPN